MRVHGDLITLDNQRLDPEELKSELFDIMSEQSIEQFNKHDSADFAHAIPEVARFRVNVFRHLNGVGAVFRGIPSKALRSKSSRCRRRSTSSPGDARS